MSLPSKAVILKELSIASIILAVGASLPYAFGEEANILPPSVKKWVSVIAVVSAGLLKTAQYTIQLVLWWTGDATATLPPLPQAMSPLAPTPPSSKL